MRHSTPHEGGESMAKDPRVEREHAFSSAYAYRALLQPLLEG